jgi:hypothetical protein
MLPRVRVFLCVGHVGTPKFLIMISRIYGRRVAAASNI